MLIVIIGIAAAPASAMSKGWAVPLEVAGGYGLGIGSSILVYATADDYKGFSPLGILYMLVVYPAASAAGVFGVGELAEGPSTNFGVTLGATLGASYGSFIGSFLFRDSFPLLSIIVPPLVDTLVYNLVKDVEEDIVEIQPDEGTYTRLISFCVGF
jgi:hypothetical protein